MSIFVSLVFVLLVIFAFARRVQPIGDRSGEGFNKQNLTSLNVASDTLTVATFNIQTGKSDKGKRDIRASARSITEADIVGIQEILAPGWMNKIGFGDSQIAALSKTGGFSWLFSPTRKRWFREQRGNLIASKLAMKSWHMIMLTEAERKAPRNMTVAKFVHKFANLGEEVVFINTHLHTKRGREQQLREVLTEFDRHPRAILVGDFNTRRDCSVLSEWLNKSDAVDAIAKADIEPNEPNPDYQRIDWILTRGFKVIGGKYLQIGVSDHPMYQVELSF